MADTTPQSTQQQDPLVALLTQANQGTSAAGMTQVAPQVPPHQVQQPAPFIPQQARMPGPVGAGQGPARKQEQQAYYATQLKNMVGQVANNIAQKKARQQQQVFDNFAQYSKGAQDAQGQMQEAMSELKKNPNDKEAYQRYLQAQAAYKQNVQNINDLTSGKNEKNAKLLAKGYGIDDKNAGTPERQAAIKAIQKTMPGINQQAGALMSKMPQTQQLTPQAQGQAAAVQAGVQGKPATQGQVLKALNDRFNQNIKAGTDEVKETLKAYSMGLNAERQPDGTYKLTPMTPEELGHKALATKGVLAWTMRNGKPVSALRNPVTNQIIPGTENPDILPPAYLTERIHEGEFTFTDGQGSVFRVPTRSYTKPVLPGASSAKTGTASSGSSKSGSAPSSGATTPSTAGMPKGSRFVGKGTDVGDLGKELTDHLLAPSELPGFGKARTGALAQARKIDPTYDPGMADIWFQQAKNPQIYMPLKYMNSLTGTDNESGNLGTIISMSDKIDRTNFPAVNSAEFAALRQSGDPNVAAYSAAITEVADQIGKILQGGGSGGGTSDAKLRQAQEILSGSFSKAQLKEVATTLRTLLGNRKKELVGDNPWLQREYGKGSDSSDVIEVKPEEMNAPH